MKKWLAGVRTGAVLLDAAVAVAAYLIGYRLRFPTNQLWQFLPGALRLMPLVVACQLASLAGTGLYRTRRIGGGFARVIAGATLGSIAAAAMTGATIGFEGLSRLSFLIDAVLLVLGACAWRGIGVLWRLARRSRAVEASGAALEDRNDPVTWIGTGLFGVFRYRELLRNLVMRDLKLKYRGSIIGVMWSMVNPLMMMLVYTIAFTYILRVGGEGFVFLLLVGLLTWTFFVNSANMSTASILDSGGLIKSVFFPRAILPVATVFFNLAQFLLTAAVFLPGLLLLSGRPLALPMVLFPAFLLLQILFTIGIALMLSACTAFFRDIKHLLEIALALMFWTTPIVYDISKLPESLQTPILLSPMSPFIVAYQRMFYYGQWPNASVTLIACIYALGALILGSVVFVAYEDRLAEQV